MQPQPQYAVNPNVYNAPSIERPVNTSGHTVSRRSPSPGGVLHIGKGPARNPGVAAVSAVGGAGTRDSDRGQWARDMTYPLSDADLAGGQLDRHQQVCFGLQWVLNFSV